MKKCIAQYSRGIATFRFVVLVATFIKRDHCLNPRFSSSSPGKKRGRVKIGNASNLNHVNLCKRVKRGEEGKRQPLKIRPKPCLFSR
jgi:hypothetical protein